jgi:hypothetical protein
MSSSRPKRSRAESTTDDPAESKKLKPSGAVSKPSKKTNENDEVYWEVSKKSSENSVRSRPACWLRFVQTDIG